MLTPPPRRPEPRHKPPSSWNSGSRDALLGDGQAVACPLGSQVNAELLRHGEAVLPLPAMRGPIMLEIHLAGSMTYLVDALPDDETERRAAA